MNRIISASNDTYITNKIINNSFRATDANVGDAGTLDLFKLYNENIIAGESFPKEYSRLLIKFPLGDISYMDQNKDIDINDPSFSCKIKLHDIYGGQTTPAKFKLILFPLSQSFTEGRGRDIVKFSDLDAVNFVTASIQNGEAILWNQQGGNASGSLGSENIDIIVSGTLDSGVGIIPLCVEQYFETGKEDLEMDITTIVSGTIAGLIPDNGFLIAFSGSYQENDKSYFVKRFASRNATVNASRPKLIVKFDDSIQDYHEDFIFNVTSSLYLLNYHYGNLSNILSGASGTELTGNDCLKLKIESGSFKEIFSVSQAKRGRHALSGIYSSSFSVSSFDNILYKEANLTGSITFNEVWTNESETVTFLSSSLVVKRENRRTANTKNQNNLLVSVLNVNDFYSQGERIKVRVFAEDRGRPIKYVKSPFEKKSQIFYEMHYRIKDVYDGKILIDFDTSTNSTRLSTDSEGMFFDIYTDSLPKGRVYSFDFLIKRNGINSIIKDAASKFKIV
jgi:hypothetical protein